MEVSSALAHKSANDTLLRLAKRALHWTATDTDWRWLVHGPTAALIRSEMPDLCRRLDESTAQNARGIHVPHTRETQILRHVRLDRTHDVEAILRAVDLLPDRPLASSFQRLIRPSPASSVRPWEEGNEYADTVRNALGWGTEPLPDLASWMEAQGMSIPTGDLGLPASIAVLTERTDDARALAHVNPQTSAIRKETGLATALGHVLLDDAPVTIDGEWEHWSTAARARAFGVALLLPEEGVRDVLRHSTSIGRAEVHAVMGRYRTGRWTTTYRLQNLGLISREEQAELVRVAR